nr:MAG TPA: hypothetical protein [Caudoviricetes sp.]
MDSAKLFNLLLSPKLVTDHILYGDTSFLAYSHILLIWIIL